MKYICKTETKTLPLLATSLYRGFKPVEPHWPFDGVLMNTFLGKGYTLWVEKGKTVGLF